MYDDDFGIFLLLIGIIAVFAMVFIISAGQRDYAKDGNPHNGWVKSEPYDYRCDGNVLIYADSKGALVDERCNPR